MGSYSYGLVEQMASDEIMLCMTGDPMWAEHCEEVAFNSYPAAVMPDFKALRYITCPNHTVSDSKNHHPGIDNRGPFLSMNPFSSRCCQHNHAQGWPYFSEHLILATPDNGIAAAIYAACKAKIKVLPATGSEMNNGAVISRHETKEKYPFYSNFPLFSILDPKVTFTLPPHQVACGLADTFVHVMEQYMTVAGQSRVMDRWAEGILQTLVERRNPAH